jgi:hypothetical protein
MKLIMSSTVPEQYKKQKGTTYETRYLYTGFGRYNEHDKTLESIQVDEKGEYDFFSRHQEAQVFSRVYHTELVTITLYSTSPRVWSETVGPVTYFFQAIEQVGPQPSF